MKLYMLCLLLFLTPFMASARGQNERLKNLGGIEVKDPFENVNKSGSTKSDKTKALEIMAQLGYGPESKKKSNNQRKSNNTER